MIVNEFTELIKISFLMEYFTPDFLRLLAQMSKFAFCVAGFITFVVLLIKPSVSGVYLKYPYFLRPLSLI